MKSKLQIRIHKRNSGRQIRGYEDAKRHILIGNSRTDDSVINISFADGPDDYYDIEVIQGERR